MMMLPFAYADVCCLLFVLVFKGIYDTGNMDDGPIFGGSICMFHIDYIL